MTPRKSARAATRDIYLKMGGQHRVLALAPEPGKGVSPRALEIGASEKLARLEAALAPTPTPDPSQQGEGEKSAPDLMARVRALYEDSVVPVVEIARLCGIHQRTLYKYVEKGGWRRRYDVPVRPAAAVPPTAPDAGRPRADGRRLRKGAGGRFIAHADVSAAVSADADTPVVHGIKALDPEARARAAAACAAASARHAKAKARADAAQAWDARCRAINAVTEAMAAYNRWRRERRRDRSRADRTADQRVNDERITHARITDERMEAMFIEQIEAAVACVKALKL